MADGEDIRGRSIFRSCSGGHHESLDRGVADQPAVDLGEAVVRDRRARGLGARLQASAVPIYVADSVPGLVPERCSSTGAITTAGRCRSDARRSDGHGPSRRAAGRRCGASGRGGDAPTPAEDGRALTASAGRPTRRASAGSPHSRTSPGRARYFEAITKRCDPGVVSISPVSRSVFSPDRIIIQPP